MQPEIVPNFFHPADLEGFFSGRAVFSGRRQPEPAKRGEAGQEAQTAPGQTQKKAQRAALRFF
ncbi:hypothetical protein K3723_18505 (plasmid) [Leisingera caerulea]|uniref:hypothetical protein n=1 Tax=Leisingera caerulea TaxID=506591 RepID=UPI0021A7B5E0|nr:hypothetical protein [Leisingera caerulea]UWQ64659.1 hypothetical protein K3723_18505 [Leisingera caerulea]